MFDFALYSGFRVCSLVVLTSEAPGRLRADSKHIALFGFPTDTAPICLLAKLSSCIADQLKGNAGGGARTRPDAQQL